MKKKLSLVAVLLIAAVLIASGMSTAQAAGAPTLPANQSLFTIEEDSYMGTMYSVDTTNAQSALVGTAIHGDGAYGAAVNPIDGQAYAFFWGGGATYLAKVDTTTGTSTKIANVNGDTSSAWDVIITNTGDAYNFDGSHLYTLDLTTAHTTDVGALGPPVDFAGYNPADDTIYAFNFSGVAYTVDPSTGVATPDPAHDVVLSGPTTCPDLTPFVLNLTNIAFDANGNAWFQDTNCTSSLLVDDFAAGSGGLTYFMGQYQETAGTLYPTAPHEFFAYAIFITTAPPAAPAMPNTGMSMVLNTTFGMSALALFVLAGTLIIMRRRLHLLASSSEASQALRDLEARLSRLEDRLRLRPLNRRR